MIVVNTPSQELAFTNFAYCSAGDFRKFAIRGSNPAQVIVGDSVVLPLVSHGNVSDGQIALNVVHRRHTKVSAGDQISVVTLKKLNLSMIVNGPEVLDKYMGQSEKNLRNLFAEAEQDQRARGDQSDLHIIIFYEIDAICKVLEHLNIFVRDDINAAAEALNKMPLKHLYAMVDKSVVREKGRNSEAFYSGNDKIDLNHFFDTLSDYAFFF